MTCFIVICKHHVPCWCIVVISLTKNNTTQHITQF